MSTTQGTALAVDLSAIFGPVYWGMIIETVLFGISVVQGYMYYSKSQDTWFLKSFVSVLLALDFVTTVLVAQSVHHYLVVNFGNELAFLFMDSNLMVVYVLTAVVTFASQLFYASRIYIVNKPTGNWIIPLIIVLLGLFGFASAMAATGEIYHLGLLIANLANRRIRIIAGLYTGLAAACDILATISLCYFLASRRSAFKGTKALLSHLFFFTVNRGLMVTIAQIGFGITFLIGPTKAIWMPFHLSLAKLHLNTLLAMLNSRSTLRARADVQLDTTKGLSSFNAPLDSSRQSVTYELHNVREAKKLPSFNQQVTITTTTEENASYIDFSEEGKPATLFEKAYTGAAEAV